MVTELDHDPFLLIFKAVVSLSGNLEPMFSGHSFILTLTFLVFMASVPVAGLTIAVFTRDIILPVGSVPVGQVSVLGGDIIIIIIFFFFFFFASVARDMIVTFI